MPDGLRPVARRWFYSLHPRLSWAKRRKVDLTTEAVADRFFDSRAEYDALEREFVDGRIGGICAAGDERLPDGWSVYDAHRDECAKLYALVRKRRPDTVVETGVWHGVSTASVLLALAANDRGSLHSLAPSARPTGGAGDRFGGRDGFERHLRRKRPSCAEPGSHRLPPGREPGWILPDDLRERWRVTPGRPTRRLPGLLDGIGPVELFVHDSVHSASGMAFEFALAWEHLAPGGVLVSPHVDWNDAFDTFVDEHDCEAGLLSFEYNGREGYDAPCSCAYAVKPADAATAPGGPG